MSDIFVSYKSDDRDRVRPIIEALEAAGWEVWWDTRIEAGRAFDREIETAIDVAKCVVVVWSTTSIDSDWVRNEASEGLDRGVLVPVSLDEVRPPLAFRRQQTISLVDSQNYGDIVDAVARFIPIKATKKEKAMLPSIGRQREVGDMRRVLETVSGGVGGTVFIGGEPGIGKTRLVREVTRDAIRQGFNVFHGHCRKELALPYEPWIEQIEQFIRVIPAEQLPGYLGEQASELSMLLPKLAEIVPDIPSRIELPPEQERRFLMNGITEYLQRQASNQPLVLVFEDLQWADESTCLLLQHLATRIEESNLLIVGTFRDAELETGSPAGAMFQTLMRERLAETVILRRLRKHEVVALLSQLSGKTPPEELVDLVFSETEGNPFFVEEVYRHLADLGKLFDSDGEFLPGITLAETDVPRSVLLVIQNRLERMSANCLSALTLAAVVGRTFTYRMLASAGDMDEDALLNAIEEADAASLIEDLSTGREANYRFVHEQIRQTLLHDLSFPRRQRMHIKIAKAMQGSKVRTVEIAHHFYAAGDAADPEETLGWLEKAINESLEALAFEDVLVILGQADEIATEDKTLARLARQRAQALSGSNNIEGAVVALEEAAAAVSDPDIETSLRLQRIQILVDAYRSDAAFDDINMLLANARAISDEPLELQVQVLLSRATYQQSLDQPGKAKEWDEANSLTIELARKYGDQIALARALMNSSRILDYWPERHAEARANIEEAHQIAHASADDRLEIEAQKIGLQIDNLPADETLHKAENIRSRLIANRDPLQLKEYLFWMMWQMYHMGKARRCVEIATEDIELSDALGLPPVQYPTIKGLALLDLGQIEEAHASISNEVATGEYRFGLAFQNYGFALYHYQLNDLETAFQIIRDLIPEMVALKRNWMIEALIHQLGRDIFTMPGENKKEALDVLDALVASTVDDGGPRKIPTNVRDLLDGNFETSIENLRKQVASVEESASRRQWLEHEDTLQRLYMKEERWSDLIARKETLFQFVEHAGLNRRQWLFFAYRARGNFESGHKDKARTDAQKARDCFEGILATVPGESLKERFKAHPMANDLQKILDATA